MATLGTQHCCCRLWKTKQRTMNLVMTRAILNVSEKYSGILYDSRLDGYYPIF
jgi:hypothetical protein